MGQSTGQQAAALAHHLEKAKARMVVLLVEIEVLGERLNALGQKRDLDLRGTGVARVGLKALHDL